MTEEPKPEDRGARRWWLTLPGILTAVAGVITAVTGLIVALDQVGLGSGGGSGPTTAASPVGGTDNVSTLTTIASGTAEPPATPGAGSYRATFPAGARARLAGAVYQITAARVERSNPGELALHLSVRMTNNGPYPANFWDRSFRLVVDGVPRAPTGSLDEVVAGHSALDGTVEFVAPAAARKLALLVGDDPQQAVRLPIVVRAR